MPRHIIHRASHRVAFSANLGVILKALLKARGGAKSTSNKIGRRTRSGALRRRGFQPTREDAVLLILSRLDIDLRG